MEERHFPFRSLLEWTAAAVGVAALVWVVSVPLQRTVGPGVEAAIAEIGDTASPHGVPAGATQVPILLLLGGREIRVGDLHTRLAAIVPERYSAGPSQVSSNDIGERHTRAYLVEGTRFYVVCERTEASGPMRVSGIYLP